MTITMEELSAKTLGALIALFERAVGFYATMVNINAYHQPGVEKGKKCADRVGEIQEAVLDYIESNQQGAITAMTLAKALGLEMEVDIVWNLLENLSLNRRGIEREPGSCPWDNKYIRRL